MTDWAVVWLGVIAVSTAVMALVQVGVVIAALRAARQLTAAAEDLRREMGPLIEKAQRVADDAQRAASLAALQLERLEAALTNTAARVDDALGIMRNAMGGPMRQGFALVMAARAALKMFKRSPRRERSMRDEEDALFVG